MEEAAAVVQGGNSGCLGGGCSHGDEDMAPVRIKR